MTPAERIDTRASVSLNENGGDYAINTIHLDVSARVAEADGEAFRKAAEKAKEGCPVSKLFNAEITMEARLEA